MNRKLLISCLIIISSAANLLVGRYDFPHWMGLLLTLSVCYGCCIWAKEKNRGLMWAFVFGFLAPIGLVGMGLLKDKSEMTGEI